MSEYWISKKKYFCKYCEIYIADDAPSRQHHENGLRHKGNLERFVRGIYKTGEKQKKDKEEEKREMQRVERAAAAAFSQDIGSGIAKPTISSAPSAASSTAAGKPTPKPSNPYANYSTPASLGYTDPDIERRAAEMQARQTQGTAGNWQLVTPSFPQPDVPSTSATQLVELSTIKPEAGEAEEVGAKRVAEVPLEEEDSRSFKIRKRTLHTGLGEIYDPGVIPIKVKKREPLDDTSTIVDAKSEPQRDEMMTPLPKWSSIQLSKRSDKTPSTSEIDPGKKEETLANASCESMPSSSKWAKAKWSEPLPDVPPTDRASIFDSGKKEPPPLDDQKSMIKSENMGIKVEEEAFSPSQDVTFSGDGGGGGGGIVFKKRRGQVNSANRRNP